MNTVDAVITANDLLEKSGEALRAAERKLDSDKHALRAAVVRIRPAGLLTVEEMAEAVRRDRNYIDSVWSEYGDGEKGKQTRVRVLADENSPLPSEYRELSELATHVHKSERMRNDARSARNAAVVNVYRSKVLGPSDIASAVGIDRNHVLRIARAAGVAPQHRPGTVNQHTVKPK